MENFKRYAIYYAPRKGAFSDKVSTWLGWDPQRGARLPFDGPDDLPRPQEELTLAPRKYGFHGTIKAPFRLKDGLQRDDVTAQLEHVVKALAPVRMEGLSLERLGGFLALLPMGDSAALLELGAQVVRSLEPLRAPLTEAEFAKRRPERLSERQRAYLETWGYPYVMDEFRFHLTLSDNLPEEDAKLLEGRLAPWLAPVLPKPFVIEDLCLFGEDMAGQFHLLERHALAA